MQGGMPHHGQNEDWIWQPTPRQAEFLAASDFEVLYGGAAGGGKSDALLVDALGSAYGAWRNPNHRALLLRRSFPELRDLIGRSHALFPAIDPGARYAESERLWVFSSGARIEFGYLQRDEDRFRYQGRAWNFLGFDELTLWPADVGYVYLMSRCRTSDPTLPCYVRATTNPNGPGQQWVMRRFGIAPEGGATAVPVEIPDPEAGTVTIRQRRFIPARLVDNPFLAQSGYRERLLELPPEDRDALLHGRWQPASAFGAYYADQTRVLRSQGRIRAVPYTPEEPVNTFWDIGWNDTTAIWFHQKIAGEDRFLRAYENSGETPEHYVAYMLGLGYNLAGRHFLPHDAHNVSLQTGQSFLALMQRLGPGLRWEIVPRISDLLVGIQQTRMKLAGNVFFDAEHCAEGLVAIDNYRKRYNHTLQAFTDQPVKDRYANLADALRQWGQVTTAEASPRTWRGPNPYRRRATTLTA